MAKPKFNAEYEQLTDNKDIALFQLRGSVDVANIGAFEDKLDQCFEITIKHLILNLKETDYINSTGMGLLVKYSDKFREKSGNIYLVNVPEKVLGTLDMLGLTSIFPVHPSEEKAIEAIIGKPYKKESPKATKKNNRGFTEHISIMETRWEITEDGKATQKNTDFVYKANIRWFRRMYPNRNFAMCVKVIKDRARDQDEPVYIEVVPHFPGCVSSPPYYRINAASALSEARFDLVPIAEGKFSWSCINIYHQGDLIESIKTPYHSTKQTVAKTAFWLSMLVPGLIVLFHNLQWKAQENLPAATTWIAAIIDKCGGPSRLAIAFGAIALLYSAVMFTLKSPEVSDPIEVPFNIPLK